MARALEVALVGLCLGACRAPGPYPVVPRATTPIKVDGHWREKDWNDVALTGRFLGPDGQMARPVSEVRLMEDDTRLLVGLYAADEDIRSTDEFDLIVGSTRFTFDPLGYVMPKIPGVKAYVDSDGSIDDASNTDEEWVVEGEIPLKVLRLAPGDQGVHVVASRCDVPRGGKRRCGSWRSTVDLAP